MSRLLAVGVQGDVAKDFMDDFVEDVLAKQEREEDTDTEKRERAEWVRMEQAKDPGLESYYKEEMRLTTTFH